MKTLETCNKPMVNDIRYFEMKNDRMIQCECGGEILTLKSDEEFQQIELSIWYRHYYPYTLLQKIKHCWFILLNGKPYGDQFLLSKEKALALSKDLEDMAHKLPVC